MTSLSTWYYLINSSSIFCFSWSLVLLIRKFYWIAVLYSTSSISTLKDSFMSLFYSSASEEHMKMRDFCSYEEGTKFAYLFTAVHLFSFSTGIFISRKGYWLNNVSFSSCMLILKSGFKAIIDSTIAMNLLNLKDGL